MRNANKVYMRPEDNKIRAPTGEATFPMHVGGETYTATFVRDGIRMLSVMDGRDESLYVLKFSKEGDGRFTGGRQKKGEETYILNRDTFGIFSLRYADHIRWLARNLDPGVCEEMLELFTLGY